MCVCVCVCERRVCVAKKPYLCMCVCVRVATLPYLSCLVHRITCTLPRTSFASFPPERVSDCIAWPDAQEGHTVREFIVESFALVGSEIVWEGSGETEVGRDKATGKVRVRVSSQVSP